MREAARANDMDRYLSALLAPRAVRDDLVTLAAFAGEIARVPRTVAEPMIGEIRLQWWWDVLADAGNAYIAAGRTGHPVADALTELVRRRGLDVAELQAAIDARRHEMYADAPADTTALMAHCDAAHGTLLRQAARILGAGASGAPLSDAARRATRNVGAAYCLARTLSDLPLARARGRNPFPGIAPGDGSPGNDATTEAQARHYCAEARTLLGRGRAALADVSDQERAALRSALLPSALVEPYLRAFEAAGAAALTTPTDITPLARAWGLLKARYGRVP